MGEPPQYGAGSFGSGYAPSRLGAPSHSYIQANDPLSSKSSLPLKTAIPSSSSASIPRRTTSGTSIHPEFDEQSWIKSLSGKIKGALSRNGSGSNKRKSSIETDNDSHRPTSRFRYGDSVDRDSRYSSIGIGRSEGQGDISMESQPGDLSTFSSNLDKGKGKEREIEIESSSLSNEEWIKQSQKEFLEKQERKRVIKELQDRATLERREVSVQTIGDVQITSNELLDVGNEDIASQLDLGIGNGGVGDRPMIQEMDQSTSTSTRDQTTSTSQTATTSNQTQTHGDNGDASVKRAILAAKAVEELLNGGGVEDRNEERINVSEAFVGLNQKEKDGNESQNKAPEDQVQSQSQSQIQVEKSQPQSTQTSTIPFQTQPQSQSQPSSSQPQVTSTSSNHQSQPLETLGADPIGPSSLFRQVEASNGGILDIEKVLMNRQGLSQIQDDSQGGMEDEEEEEEEEEDQIMEDEEESQRAERKLIEEINNNANFGSFMDGDPGNADDEEEEDEEDDLDDEDDEDEEELEMEDIDQHQSALPNFHQSGPNFNDVDGEDFDEEEDDVVYDSEGYELEIVYDEYGQGTLVRKNLDQDEEVASFAQSQSQSQSASQVARGRDKDDAIVLSDSDDDDPPPPKSKSQSQNHADSSSSQAQAQFNQRTAAPSEDEDEEEEEEEENLDQRTQIFSEEEEEEAEGLYYANQGEDDQTEPTEPMFQRTSNEISPPSPPPLAQSSLLSARGSTTEANGLALQDDQVMQGIISNTDFGDLDYRGQNDEDQGREDQDDSFEIVEPPTANQEEKLPSQDAQLPTESTSREDLTPDEKAGSEALAALGVGIPSTIETPQSELQSQTESQVNTLNSDEVASSYTSQENASSAPVGAGKALLALKAVAGGISSSPVGSTLSNKGVSPTASLAGVAVTIGEGKGKEKSSEIDLKESMPPPLPVDNDPMINSGEELTALKDDLRTDQATNGNGNLAESEKSQAGSGRRTSLIESGNVQIDQARSNLDTESSVTTPVREDTNGNGDLAQIPPATDNPIVLDGEGLIEIKTSGNDGLKLETPQGSQKSEAGDVTQPQNQDLAYLTSLASASETARLSQTPQPAEDSQPSGDAQPSDTPASQLVDAEEKNWDISKDDEVFDFFDADGERQQEAQEDSEEAEMSESSKKGIANAGDVEMPDLESPPIADQLQDQEIEMTSDEAQQPTTDLGNEDVEDPSTFRGEEAESSPPAPPQVEISAAELLAETTSTPAETTHTPRRSSRTTSTTPARRSSRRTLTGASPAPSETLETQDQSQAPNLSSNVADPNLEESEESELEEDDEEPLLLSSSRPQFSQNSQRVSDSQPSMDDTSTLEPHSQRSRIEDSQAQPFGPGISSEPSQSSQSQKKVVIEPPKKRPTTHHHHHGQKLLARTVSSGSSMSSIVDDPQSGEAEPTEEVEEEKYKLPETRSHCSYHIIRLASLPTAPTFLAPGCSFQADKLKTEGAVDVRTVTSRDMRNSEEFNPEDLPVEVHNVLSRIVGISMLSELLLYPMRGEPKVTELSQDLEKKEENEEEESNKKEEEDEESHKIKRPLSPTSTRASSVGARSPRKSEKALPTPHKRGNPSDDKADYTPENQKKKGKGRSRTSSSASKKLNDGDLSIEVFEREAADGSQEADVESMQVDSVPTQDSGPSSSKKSKGRRSNSSRRDSSFRSNSKVEEAQESSDEGQDLADISMNTKKSMKKTKKKNLAEKKEREEKERRKIQVEDEREAARIVGAKRTLIGTGEERKGKRKARDEEFKPDEAEVEAEEEAEEEIKGKKSKKGKGKAKELSSASNASCSSPRSGSMVGKMKSKKPRSSRSKSQGTEQGSDEGEDLRMDIDDEPAAESGQSQSQSQRSLPSRKAKRSKD